MGWQFCDKGKVQEQGEEENVSASSQNCVHLTAPVHLRFLKMKITLKHIRLLKKAADNYKHKEGNGNRFPLCKIACY